MNYREKKKNYEKLKKQRFELRRLCKKKREINEISLSNNKNLTNTKLETTKTIPYHHNRLTNN